MTCKGINLHKSFRKQILKNLNIKIKHFWTKIKVFSVCNDFMASDVLGFGKIKERRKDDEEKKLSILAFLPALSCKFNSNLIS